MGRRLDAALMRMALVVCLASALSGVALAQRGVAVLGLTRDSTTGRGLSGASVEIASATKRFAVRSDEAAEFRISDVEPNAYRLVVRRIGYAQVVRNIVVAVEMKPIVINLSPVPHSLREVRVRAAGIGIYGEIGALSDLKVVSGAHIQVAGANETAVTDSGGSYFVPIKKPGVYIVRVKADGFSDDMFVVEVQRDQIGDGSRLLDPSDGSHSIPEGLWKDFDQRLRWRSPTNSTLVPGSEVRRAGGGLTEAVQRIGSVVAHGLRMGSTVCVFVNGAPRPGFGLNAIRTEEITAMEVYGPDREAAMYLEKLWPRGALCSETGFRSPPRGARAIKYLVIWTK